jgi:hypothetical protein
VVGGVGVHNAVYDRWQHQGHGAKGGDQSLLIPCTSLGQPSRVATYCWCGGGTSKGRRRGHRERRSMSVQQAGHATVDTPAAVVEDTSLATSRWCRSQDCRRRATSGSPCYCCYCCCWSHCSCLSPSRCPYPCLCRQCWGWSRRGRGRLRT